MLDLNLFSIANCAALNVRPLHAFIRCTAWVTAEKTIAFVWKLWQKPAIFSYTAGDRSAADLQYLGHVAQCILLGDGRVALGPVRHATRCAPLHGQWGNVTLYLAAPEPLLSFKVTVQNKYNSCTVRELT